MNAFSPGGDIARRAFDAVAAAQAVGSLAELEAAVGRPFGELGFHVHMGVDAIYARRSASNVQFLFGRPPEVWHARYLEQGYAAHDILMRHLRSSTEPVFWSDITERHRPEGTARRIFDEAAELGYTNGFMTPLHHADGVISAVVLMADGIDGRDPHLRTAAHLLSLHYGAVGRRLAADPGRREARSPSLTPRQRECLLWVRMGKSSADIGDLLGLSAETVNEHIAGACARLGVRTRVQAVAEAAARGMIAL